MKLIILCLALVAVGVSGLAVQPGCPEYILRNSPLYLTSADNFVANVFHQNAAPNDFMHGTPVGPYFDFDESACTWRPSGAFNCKVRIYADAARQNLIGNGTLSSSNLIRHDDALHLVSGDMLVQTSIAPHAFLPKPAELSHRDNRNFLSQSTSVHFRRQVEWPQTGTPISNRVMNVSNNAAEVLTLWGSNGYSAASNDFSGERGTGIDLRARLECPGELPPPIIVNCPECPTGTNVIAYSSVQSGVAIERSAPDRCLVLSFSAAQA